MTTRKNAAGDPPGRDGAAADGRADTLDAWAERYLDLWQRQLADAAADPRVAELTARTVELMNAGVDALLTLAEAGGRSAKPDAAPSSAAPQAGTAPAGAPSRAAQPDVGELAQRLARLEERIARLESAQSGRAGRSAAKRAAGKRAARPKRGGRKPTA